VKCEAAKQKKYGEGEVFIESGRELKIFDRESST